MKKTVIRVRKKQCNVSSRMNYLEFAFKGQKYARNLVFLLIFCQSFWNIKKILNICKKLRISVISSSQWNMSLGSIFWITWKKVMHTREAPDFGGLYQNMNCAFPLTMTLPKKQWASFFLCYSAFVLICWVIIKVSEGSI